MSTFDNTKIQLKDLLRDISRGRIQLPDFQRGWVWDDEHIRNLLVSIARSFPIGTIMLLETGGQVRFQTRPIEGTEKLIPPDQEPEQLILDGQQRLTTLTKTLLLDAPVNTRTHKGKEIKCYYYFDIRKALEKPDALDEAIIAVDEQRQQRSDFGRNVTLDLSTPEKECMELYFPCNQIMNYSNWEKTLLRVARQHFDIYVDFRDQVLTSFHDYQLPVIQLRRGTPKEAVCLVFEKINTGGVPLTVFELVTASFAAEGYNLRDDWYGSKDGKKGSRQERIKQNPLLDGTDATEFLQGISLLYTHELRQADLNAGKNPARPISAKRADVLQLPLSAWQRWADKLEAGYLEAGKFLNMECFYSRRDLPYSTQLVPLAAVMARIGHRWLERPIYNKLSQWFWCGVLGELYGGTVDTRIANDYEDLLRWIDDDTAVPRTVRDANFQPERLDTLRSRQSAVYKGIHVLILREGAKDWFYNAGIHEMVKMGVNLDIHHIFPRNWCEKRGIAWNRYDNILNKTTISYTANRKMGGYAPSVYLPRIQNDKQVRLSDDEMNDLLASHAMDPALLRNDDFDRFIEDRRHRLIKLIERAMGKPVNMSASSTEDQAVVQN